MALIPDDMVEMVNKIANVSRQKLSETGREPTLEELAEELAIPLETVRRVVDIAKTRVRI